MDKVDRHRVAELEEFARKLYAIGDGPKAPNYPQVLAECELFMCMCCVPHGD